MKRAFVVYLAVVAALVISASATTRLAEEDQAVGLELRLEAPGTIVGGSQVMVRVELRNSDPKNGAFILDSVIPPAFALQAPPGKTVVWPFQVLSFEVRNPEGKVVPYRSGSSFKSNAELWPPTGCQLTALGVGGFHGWSIRLDQDYDLSIRGKYSVTAVLRAQTRRWFQTKGRNRLGSCISSGDLPQVINGTFRSNAVEFEIR